MKVVLFVGLVTIIVAAAIAISGLVVMLLTNVILDHYSIKTLGYQEGVALALLLGMVGGAGRAANSSNK
jgi:hypothetical protein